MRGDVCSGTPRKVERPPEQMNHFQSKVEEQEDKDEEHTEETEENHVLPKPRIMTSWDGKHKACWQHDCAEEPGALAVCRTCFLVLPANQAGECSRMVAADWFQENRGLSVSSGFATAFLAGPWVLSSAFYICS